MGPRRTNGPVLCETSALRLSSPCFRYPAATTTLFNPAAAGPHYLLPTRPPPTGFDTPADRALALETGIGRDSISLLVIRLDQETQATGLARARQKEHRHPAGANLWVAVRS
jgi:hypothetical protein